MVKNNIKNAEEKHEIIISIEIMIMLEKDNEKYNISNHSNNQNVRNEK